MQVTQYYWIITSKFVFFSQVAERMVDRIGDISRFVFVNIFGCEENYQFIFLPYFIFFSQTFSYGSGSWLWERTYFKISYKGWY